MIKTRAFRPISSETARLILMNFGIHIDWITSTTNAKQFFATKPFSFKAIEIFLTFLIFQK